MNHTVYFTIGEEQMNHTVYFTIEKIIRKLRRLLTFLPSHVNMLDAYKWSTHQAQRIFWMTIETIWHCWRKRELSSESMRRELAMADEQRSIAFSDWQSETSDDRPKHGTPPEEGDGAVHSRILEQWNTITVALQSRVQDNWNKNKDGGMCSIVSEPGCIPGFWNNWTHYRRLSVPCSGQLK